MNWNKIGRMIGILLAGCWIAVGLSGCNSTPSDSIYFEELTPQEMDRLTMEATNFAVKNPSVKAQFKPILQRTAPQIRSHYDGNRHGKVEFRWEVPVVILPPGAPVTSQSVNPLLVRVIASGDLDHPEWKFASVHVDELDPATEKKTRRPSRSRR